MDPETEKPHRRRPSAWHRPLWWVNIGAALLLLVTFLAPRVSPQSQWWLAVLAFTFPFQVLVHFVFLGWWFLFRRRRMLLSLLVLLIGWSHVGDHFQLFGRSAPTTEALGTPVKLMSYNVRLFDLYNWSGNKVTRDKIFEVLRREDPDILCIQEFFHSGDKKFFRTREPLLKEFRFKAVHDRYTHKARLDQHFGIATFSVHPIIDTGSISFPENPNNQCIWSDILIHGDTVRVYNAHLASYHFGDEDYRFLEALDTDTRSDSLRSGGKRILKRLRRGVILRASEVERIADHMAHSPHPVIYCGDMNDVPMSYSYTRLRNHLEDAFVNSGRGHGGTYVGRLPPLRIDHILHSPSIESWDMRTLPEELSDHRALTCSLAVRR
jgi:endonuclease/exonuclease/phosphatase family metal-dependent hydrolase